MKVYTTPHLALVECAVKDVLSDSREVGSPWDSEWSAE